MRGTFKRGQGCTGDNATCGSGPHQLQGGQLLGHALDLNVALLAHVLHLTNRQRDKQLQQHTEQLTRWQLRSQRTETLLFTVGSQTAVLMFKQ